MKTPSSIILGGGCFWCLEAVYQRIPGVEKVVSGYSGGHMPDPDYRSVCEGTTGHAEVVKIDYNADTVSLDDILEIFWKCHDPTTLNRQGADTGTQYRSVIFFADELQKSAAVRSRDRAAASFKNPIVTQIVPLEKFFPAEDYHQNYYNLNSGAPYCGYIILPKLSKLGLVD